MMTHDMITSIKFFSSVHESRVVRILSSFFRKSRAGSQFNANFMIVHKTILCSQSEVKINSGGQKFVDSMRGNENKLKIIK